MHIKMNSTNKYLITEAIEEFIQMKQEELETGDIVEDTFVYYEERLNLFCHYLTDETPYRFLHEIDKKIIKNYMDFKKEYNQNISNQTLNNHLRALRTFVNYFIEDGKIGYFKIKMYPKTSKPKAPYTKEEQIALTTPPDMKNCSFDQYRNYVISCHLMVAGNRSKTLRHILNENIDLKGRLIQLEKNKNGEIYYMAITDEYYPILKEYMKIRGGSPKDYLFCTRDGRQISASGLRTAMHRYNKKNNVQTTGIHRYRNTVAYELTKDKVDKRVIQSILTQKTPHMVDEYYKFYGNESLEELNKSSPLAKIKKVQSRPKRIQFNN